MAVKASSQVTLVDLTDAYGVVVGSEAHVFMGDTDSVSSTQTTSFMVSAMCGGTQVPCSVGTITCPTGISAVSDGKKPSPTVTITATSALRSGGALDIPVTIEGGIVIHKTFSYAIAFTGKTGATGAAGKGIRNATTTYQAGASGTTPPSGEWQATIPSVSAGQYLWTRTVTTYTDGTSTTAYAVGKMGNTGATGSAGKGVKSTAVTYNVHTSGTSAPTDTWTSTIPTVPEGQYLWTRTITTYTDNSTSTAYSVSKMGAKGDKGEQGDKGDTGATGATGKGVKSITPQYYLSTSNTSQTGGTWQDTEPEYVSGRYYWTRSKIVWTDNKTTYTSAVLAEGVNNANQSAESANETANSAQDTANNAQNTANNAASDADAAQSAAENAQQAADNAQQAADNAQEMAGNAQQIAMEAQAASDKANELASGATAGLQQISQVFYADATGAHVKAANDNETVIQSDGMHVMVGDTEVARFTRDDSHVDNLAVGRFLMFGAHRAEVYEDGGEVGTGFFWIGDVQ